jgi:hypothetical protein
LIGRGQLALEVASGLDLAPREGWFVLQAADQGVILLRHQRPYGETVGKAIAEALPLKSSDVVRRQALISGANIVAIKIPR